MMSNSKNPPVEELRQHSLANQVFGPELGGTLRIIFQYSDVLQCLIEFRRGNAVSKLKSGCSVNSCTGEASGLNIPLFCSNTVDSIMNPTYQSSQKQLCVLKNEWIGRHKYSAYDMNELHGSMNEFGGVVFSPVWKALSMLEELSKIAPVMLQQQHSVQQ